jgi:spore maturation protein CgeB
MRTFEIPACGGAVMVSTYTKEQNEFFPEGEAACYYRNPSELDHIIERLLGDKAQRRRIAKAALCIAKQHDYTERAKQLLKTLKEVAL